MRNLLFGLPLFFCVVGCTTVRTEESSAVILAHNTNLAPFKTLQSPARGRLILSYDAPTGIEGKSVTLLLLEREVPAKSRPHFEGYMGSKGPVTLLVVEPATSTSPKGWRSINSIELGMVNKRHRDFMKVRWLEPDKQMGPVLVVNKLDGIRELIALPEGWSQSAPVRQGYNDWMRWDDSAKYDFHAVDSRGFLCVTETYTSYLHDMVPGKTEVSSINHHFWDGTGWK